MTKEEIRNVLGYWYHKELYKPLPPEPDFAGTFPWEDSEPDSTPVTYHLSGGRAVVKDLQDFFGQSRSSDLFFLDRDQETVFYTLSLDQQGRYVKDSFRLSYFCWAISRVQGEEEPSLNPALCEELNIELDEELRQANPSFTDDIIHALTNSIAQLLYGERTLPADLNAFSLTTNFPEDSLLLTELRQAAGRITARDQVMDYAAGLTEEPKLANLHDADIWKQYLKPEDYPLTQWPDAEDLNLSQQWVVNRVTDPGARGKIMAFHAPSRTGRDKIITDIVADSIYKKAELLAALAKPSDAFTMRRFAFPPNDFSGNFYVPLLELSNQQVQITADNRAVLEIMLHILTDRDQADRQAAHTDAFDASEAKELYFTKFAGQYLDSDAWGLSAVILAKDQDLKRLVEGLLPLMSPQASGWQNLSTTEERLLSWDEAKNRFFRAKDKVEKKLENLATTYAASEEAAAIEVEKEEISLRIETMRIESQKTSRELAAVESEIRTARLHLDGREDDLRHLHKEMRGFGRILFKLFRVGKYAPEVRVLEQQIAESREELRRRENRQQEVSRENRDQRLKLELLEKQLEIKEQQLLERRPATDLMKAALGRNYADHWFYKSLESEETQAACPWMDFEFASLRERLLKASFDLLKSFVIHASEVSQNLNRLDLLLKGSYTEEDVEYALPSLLHTLQLIVPVTLIPQDYMRELMKHGRKAENGTLIILDPERSEPAELVGPIWRSNKTITLGDHLQLARRKTPDIRFLHVLARNFRLPEVYSHPDYSAADFLQGTQEWVFQLDGQTTPFPMTGRRFLTEPLWSLDNELSWGGRLYGTAQESVTMERSFLNSSSWLEIGGECSPESLFVPLQADLLTDQIATYVERHKALPEISIVCYFPSVYQGFCDYVAEVWQKEDSVFLLHFSAEEISHWLQEHVFLLSQWDGRVREEVVFLTGGAEDTPLETMDRFTLSAKPLHTLFNTVSGRLEIIGDPAVWANRPPLDKIYNSLNRDNTPQGLYRKTVVFIRAGRTAEDREDMISDTDSHLSEEGEEELRLKGPYPETAAYYTSGLVRAKESLRILFPNVHLKLERADFNEAQLRDWVKEDYDPVEAKAFIQCWYAGDDLGEEVETYKHLLKRCQDAVNTLLMELERVGSASATVVTHKLWLRTYFMNLQDHAEHYDPYISFNHGEGFRVEYHKVGKQWKPGKVDLIPGSSAVQEDYAIPEDHTTEGSPSLPEAQATAGSPASSEVQSAAGSPASSEVQAAPVVRKAPEIHLAQEVQETPDDLPMPDDLASPDDLATPDDLAAPDDSATPDDSSAYDVR